jgi:hypothetical protein
MMIEYPYVQVVKNPINERFYYQIHISEDAIISGKNTKTEEEAESQAQEQWKEFVMQYPGLNSGDLKVIHCRISPSF